MITLEDIDNAESAMLRVNETLDSIGRELYKMRNDGASLNTYHYYYNDYTRTIYQGPEYHDHDVDWGVGTPTIIVSYYWPRAQDYEYVSFPQAWLEQDWKSLELARLEAEKAKEAERLAAEEQKKASDHEAFERAEFERLKNKYSENH